MHSSKSASNDRCGQEKHLAFGIFHAGLLATSNTLISDTKFQGQRGINGEVWSAGYFTLKSEWQNYNLMLYARTGDKLAFTVAPTVELPLPWAALPRSTAALPATYTPHT